MNVKLIESTSDGFTMRYFVFGNSTIEKFSMIFISLIKKNNKSYK